MHFLFLSVCDSSERNNNQNRSHQVDIPSEISQDSLQVYGPECVTCLWHTLENGLCNQSFLSVIDFHKHVNSHANEKTNELLVCRWLGCSYKSQIYKSKSGLILHLQCHHIEINAYSCSKCGCCFKSPKNLSIHLRRHDKVDNTSGQTTMSTSKFLGRHEVKRSGRSIVVTFRVQAQYAGSLLRFSTQAQ